MDSLPVIIVGIIGLVSVGWQFKLLENDQLVGRFGYRSRYLYDLDHLPLRLKSGLVVGAIILVGVVFYSSYLLFDPKITNYTILSAAKCVGLALVFGLLFVLKSYFGPLVLGYVAGYSVYMFFQHDKLIIAPVVDWLLGLLFAHIPPWLDMSYTILLSLYLITVSGLDLADQWGLE